jgi:hypothetical protein
MITNREAQAVADRFAGQVDELVNTEVPIKAIEIGDDGYNDVGYDLVSGRDVFASINVQKYTGEWFIADCRGDVIIDIEKFVARFTCHECRRPINYWHQDAEGYLLCPSCYQEAKENEAIV